MIIENKRTYRIKIAIGNDKLTTKEIQKPQAAISFSKKIFLVNYRIKFHPENPLTKYFLTVISFQRIKDFSEVRKM